MVNGEVRRFGAGQPTADLEVRRFGAGVPPRRDEPIPQARSEEQIRQEIIAGEQARLEEQKGLIQQRVRVLKAELDEIEKDGVTREEKPDRNKIRDRIADARRELNTIGKLESQVARGVSAEDVLSRAQRESDVARQRREQRDISRTRRTEELIEAGFTRQEAKAVISGKDIGKRVAIQEDDEVTIFGTSPRPERFRLIESRTTRPTQTELERGQSLPADIRELPFEEVTKGQSLVGGFTTQPILTTKVIGTFKSEGRDIPITDVFFQRGDILREATEEEKEFVRSQPRDLDISRREPLGILESARERIQFGREEVRVKRLRGEEIGLRDELRGGVLAGLGFSAITTLEFGKGILTEPRQTARELKGGIGQASRRIKSGEGFPEITRIIRDEPSFALGFIGGEILQFKGAGLVIKGGKVAKAKVGDILRETRIKAIRRTVSSRELPRFIGGGEIRKGFELEIDLTKELKFQREILSEGTVRVLERRLPKGVSFEPTQRAFIKGQIETKLRILDTPDKIKKVQPLTFDFIDTSNLASQRARLRSGADVVDISDIDNIKIVEAVDKPKKIKPLSVGLDPEFIRDLLSRQKARLRSGADVVDISDIDNIKIVEAVDKPKKIKPLTFDLDFDLLKSIANRRKARLRSGADVVDISDIGNIKVVEAKPTQKQILLEQKQQPFIISPKQESIRQLALQKFRQSLSQERKIQVVKQQEGQTFQGRLDVKLELQESIPKNIVKIKQGQLSESLSRERQPSQLQTRQVFAQRLSSSLVPVTLVKAVQVQARGQNVQQSLASQSLVAQSQDISLRFRTPSTSQRLSQRSLLRVNQGLKFRTPVRPAELKFEEPKRTPRLRERRRDSIRQRTRGIGVEVRRGGVFRTIGTGLSLPKAIEVGRGRVERTLGATFRLTGVTGRGIKTPRGFRRKETPQGILFIERRRRRLSTTGEVGEIQTARGIQLNQRIKL